VLVIIDCDKCAIRGVGCSDCVISVLLNAPGTVELTDPELKAIGALADAGLVPKLRLVPIGGSGDENPATNGMKPSTRQHPSDQAPSGRDSTSDGIVARSAEVR
jgi:hypothetical protein